MDFTEALKALYQERDLLTQAIATLERVHAGTHERRRGRPPKWLTQVRDAVEMDHGDGAGINHGVNHKDGNPVRRQASAKKSKPKSAGKDSAATQ